MKKFLSTIFIIFVSVILSFAANIDELKKAAEQGDADAQCNLGLCYAKGDGVERNPTEAIKWWRKAAEQKNVKSQCNLGLCYLHGDGIERNPTEAIKWFRKAAEQGYVGAQFILGLCYAQGDGVEKNLTEAVKLWRKSAEQGYDRALYFLGMCYAHGLYGFEIDKEKAINIWEKVAEQGNAEMQFRISREFSMLRYTQKSIKWTIKAAEQGHVEAQYELGKCYYDGNGVAKSPKEAVRWYQKAAEQGHVEAQYELGKCYYDGDGVSKSPREVVKWWRKAAAQGHFMAKKKLLTNDPEYYRKEAEQGDKEAQYKLGIIYFRGGCVDKDYSEAEKWLREAAEQGKVDAQRFLTVYYSGVLKGTKRDSEEYLKWNRKLAERGDKEKQYILGLCYSLGKDVDKDYTEAVKWMRKSAEQGYVEAQYMLGKYYYRGEGVIQNNIKAYAWFALASSNGFDDAMEMMCSLKREMTPLQIERAINLAENYSKGIFDETPKKANATKTGSGFAITANGYIVTNCHVVEDSSKITLVRDGLEYPATIVAADESNDIAILKISSSTIPLPLITSRKTKIGNAVYSMGFPNVQLQGLSPKFTSGLISSLTGLRDDPKHFQISVPIQPGNSGGALVDNRGNVIGVVTAKLSQKAAINTTGTIAENVNYALKSSYVLILLESLPEISDKLMDENSSEMPSDKIAEKLQNSTYFIIAQ